MDNMLAGYTDHLTKNRRQSAATVRAYTATAERLTAFLSEHWGHKADRQNLAAVSSADLRAYLSYRRNVNGKSSGLTNRSVARELSAIRNFLRFALGENAAIPAIKGPRAQRSLPRPVTGGSSL